MKKALILATVGGFLFQFEQENVRILASLGYEVHYAANLEEEVYLFDASEKKELPVRLHHLPVCKSPYRIAKNRKALKELEALIQREHFDLIHCHTPVGGRLGRLAAKGNTAWDIKTAYTAHGFHFYKGAPVPGRWIFHTVERRLAHFTDALIVINREDYENALKFRLKPGGEVVRIPGVGLDTDRYAPYTEKQRREARGKLGIPEDALFLVCVGELNKNKNQRVILEALAKMKKSYPESGSVFCGICGDGPERENLAQRIRALKLEREVTLYGYCHPVAQYIGCADAMLFPSKREGLGMAALEALAMGVPVIAADNRGTREYMHHKENGWVCRPDDVSGYADGIRYIMNLDEGSREEMKRACRESVREFTKEKTAEVMRRVYERLDREICGTKGT